MNCAYHSDRPAVNTCSKCRQPVCASCNYIAGKAPICRKCWEKIEHATLDGRSLPYEQEYAPPISPKPAGLSLGKTIFFSFLAIVVLTVGGFFTYRTFFPPPKVVNIWEAAKKPLRQGESLKVAGESNKSRSHSYNVAGIPGSPNPSGAGELVLMTSANLGDTWFYNYGDDSDEACTDLIQASDGGLVMCGTGYWGGKTGQDNLLLKTGKDGSPKWLRKWGGDGDQQCNSLRETPDGGFILCGSGYNEETKLTNLLLTRTDPDGKVLWDKKIGGDTKAVGFCVRLTSDGGFIICGGLTPKGSDSTIPWVIKTDSEGKTIWENRFSEKKDLVGFAKCVQENSEGRYIGTGYLFFGTDVGVATGWQFVLDGNGKFVADTFFAEQSATVGTAFIETKEGDTAVAGFTCDKPGKDSTGLILLLNREGEAKWTKTYSDVTASSIVQSADGGFITCGYWLNSPLSKIRGGGKSQLWINKTSKEGAEVWDCTGYTRDMEDISGMAVVKTSDGGYVLAGHLNIKKQSDVFLMKIYPDGQPSK